MPRALRGRFEPRDHFVLGHLSILAPLSALGSPHAVKRFIELAIVVRTRSHASRTAWHGHHEPEAVHPCRYRHEPETGHPRRYRGRGAGRFGAVASAGASALRRKRQFWCWGPYRWGMSAVGALFVVAGIGFCGVSGAQRRESALGVCRAHGAGFLGGRYAAVVAVCTLEAASTSGGFRDVSTLCVHRSCCDARRPTERVLDADAGMSRHDGSTTIEDAKPKSVTMGIIFNFTKGTLQGFGTLINYPVK